MVIKTDNGFENRERKIHFDRLFKLGREKARRFSRLKPNLLIA